MKVQYLDKVIIDGVRRREQKFENILFERFKGIELYNDAPDEIKFSLYVDTISDVILYIRNKRNKEIEYLKAFVKTIFERKFKKYLKIKKREEEKYKDLEPEIFKNMPDDNIPNSLLEPSEEEEMKELVNVMFENISKRCKEIFQARFISGMKFSEIATELNFSSDNSAKNANHDCLKQARSKCKTIIKVYHGGE